MWHCGKCLQEVDDGLSVCWSCGTSKMGVEDPSFKSAEALEATGSPADSVALGADEETVLLRPCVKCGEEKVMPRQPIRDHMGEYGATELVVMTHKDPDAIIFKGTTTSRLFADVCGRCGYAEIYANDPMGLLRAYMESRES